MIDAVEKGLGKGKVCYDSWPSTCDIKGVGECYTGCTNKYQNRLINAYCETRDNTVLCGCAFHCNNKIN